ncbi:hypothetical protein P7K49_006219, partial [Saguinus oedipus]
HPEAEAGSEQEPRGRAESRESRKSAAAVDIDSVQQKQHQKQRHQKTNHRIVSETWNGVT